MTFVSEKVLQGLARFQRDLTKKTRKRKRKENPTAGPAVLPPSPPPPPPSLQQSSTTAAAAGQILYPQAEISTGISMGGEFDFGRAEDDEFPSLGRIFISEWNLKEEESITSNPVSAMREQIQNWEAKYKAFEDKSDYGNALAINLGYKKLKADFLEALQNLTCLHSTLMKLMKRGRG